MRSKQQPAPITPSLLTHSYRISELICLCLVVLASASADNTLPRLLSLSVRCSEMTLNIVRLVKGHKLRTTYLLVGQCVKHDFRHQPAHVLTLDSLHSLYFDRLER